MTRSLTGNASRPASDTPRIDLEIDYLGVYGIGFYEHNRFSTLMNASLLTRLGHFQEAAEKLGDVETLLAGGGVNRRMVLGAIFTLREAGQYDRALALAERLLSSGQLEGIDRLAVAHTIGTIHLKAGNVDAAAEAFAQFLESSDEIDPGYKFSSALMLATAELVRGRVDAAEAAIARTQAAHAPSSHDLFGFHVVTGQILLEHGDYAEADAAFDRALHIAEEGRAELRSASSRTQWFGGQEDVFELAVFAALGCGDTRRMFEIAERSKARSLLDRMAARRPTGAEPETPASRALAKERERRSLLVGIQEIRGRLGDAYVDVESVQRLDELGNDVLETDSELPRIDWSKVGDAIAATARRIEACLEEIENADTTLTRTGEEAAPISYAALRVMLSEASVS
jgi:tetratricopeptide (TPR) repeat protein